MSVVGLDDRRRGFERIERTETSGMSLITRMAEGRDGAFEDGALAVTGCRNAMDRQHCGHFACGAARFRPFGSVLLVEQIAECRDCVGYFRSEEHTSELQSLMRISYAVFCL